MICQDTYNWLLASRPDAPMPLSMRDHLAKCPRCRAHRRRLRDLDRELRRLPPPPADPQAVERLLRKVEQMSAPELLPLAPLTLPSPPSAGGEGRVRGSARRWPINWRLVASVAAVLVLVLGAGWLLLPPRAHDVGPGDEPSAEQVAAVNALRNQEPLVARVLGHDLRLAGTFKPAEQFQVLAELARDLGAEALRQAAAEHSDTLAVVSLGYTQVVRRGLVGRSRAVPAENRAKLVAPVVKELQQTSSAADRLARSAAPDVRDALQTLRAAAETAIALLYNRQPPADDLPPLQVPAVSGSPRDLVGALVAEGIRLAEESDPLRRADYCVNVGDQLVATILQVAAADDDDQARQLGQYLGEVLARGVVPNLRRAEAADSDGRRLAEYRRIGERGVKAAAVLRQKLEQAPPRVRVGLEKAVEAARSGVTLAAEAANAGQGQDVTPLRSRGQAPPANEVPARPMSPR
jgi:hypothetical protein